MRLCDIELNQCCVIVSIEKTCSLSNRLKELGFISGQKVICSDISLFSSPVAYKLCGTKIALRKNTAQMIEVKLIEK